MMKKAIFIISCLSLTALVACKKGGVLDQVKTTDLNEETTFADSARTLQFLTRIYTDIGFSAEPKRFGDGSSVGIYSIGDEVESTLQSASAYNIIFQSGAVSALNIPDDAWVKTYANIRRVNVLLKHLPTTPLSAKLRSRMEGEARFLRAWYYFILIKHYAGVPLIGDVVYGPTDEISGKRNTYAECVTYIENECNAVATLLPPSYSGLDYGRVTRGAALALKARLLLYAASPLFNGRADNMDGVLGYPSFDATRWTKAARAAKDVIDLNLYALFDLPTQPGYGFQKVFVTRKNNEYILASMAGNNRTLESMWDPPSRTGSGNSLPYQELVDAFGTVNGKPISEDVKSGSNPTGYDAANPYVNRDPRLAYTVLFNEGTRLNVSRTVSQVFTYVGAPQDGYAPNAGTRTGYYLRKMCDDNTIASTTSSATERCFPLIRYAEILLNYAEASNEAGDIATAYEQLKAIRKRAGIVAGNDGNYGLADGMTKDQMRTVIQNERRVELAIEEHRYWDVRRWKIAENIANKPLHGMKITKVGNTYTYELVTVRTPVFTAPKWYLWPIPQGEVNKSLDLQQNPGW
ncbi:RagB/SusD family nutrient uptake outer membrane protein [Nubsella zeaxanthinifaciens]|uniref:RagB/SusD family nutrient uptake outer membrane protein n=1 Tax=Nubsella zeaxanthinifaciens TaxID=392412 RepID=UPI0018E53725|nr:RagB/SusD family nutrient uptake outer membrane protein [Nubsella zeaxanthinifaciens]